jgi:alcohol dehydrogenase
MAYDIPTTMKAWRLDRLGGDLSFDTVPVPEVRPGTVLLKVEAAALVSYMKAYVEGQLPSYHAPDRPFTPGGNCVGTIVSAGRDVWQLKAGQRMLVSSLVRSSENVPDPSQMLIGITSFGGASQDLQGDFPDGSLAEYVLLPTSAVVPVEGFEDMPPSQLNATARFVVPYGGLVRGRLAPGETVVIDGSWPPGVTAKSSTAWSAWVVGQSFRSLLPEIRKLTPPPCAMPPAAAPTWRST